MLCALPAGWAADHGRRDSTLRVAAAVGAAAALGLAFALLTGRGVWAVGAAVAALGAWKGLVTPPAEAIFADSVETGRSSPYTHKFALSALAGAAGPALSVALFAALGDVWRAGDCKAVILLGVAAMAAPLAVACLFDDDATLGRHSEALT
jgi:MFS family permease